MGYSSPTDLDLSNLSTLKGFLIGSLRVSNPSLIKIYIYVSNTYGPLQLFSLRLMNGIWFLDSFCDSRE